MTTGLELYDKTAQDAAARVIARYSTSFGLACRLLGGRVRPHVRNVYALVRVADEIVDGPAAAAGLDENATRQVLDALEVETLEAVARGFSANLVVHAFAMTARECGIEAEVIRPFFASMRTDITVSAHDAASHDEYVYGSAEVVGLMCLRVFLGAGSPGAGAADAELADGARRLGRAFQDVNFLRDLRHDRDDLGRDYLGSGALDRWALLDRIDADLAAAARVIPRLPADSRRAVTAAHDLFADLSSRLRAPQQHDQRTRVPNTAKARIAAHAWLGLSPRTHRAVTA